MLEMLSPSEKFQGTTHTFYCSELPSCSKRQFILGKEVILVDSNTELVLLSWKLRSILSALTIFCETFLDNIHFINDNVAWGGAIIRD